MSRDVLAEPTWRPTLRAIEDAGIRLKNVAIQTRLERHPGLSGEFEARVLLKREDLQIARSYKIRGAYNRISMCSEEERENGVACASAGNHAQGVAYACSLLGIRASIYMPVTTPSQKVEQVRMFGGQWVDIVLSGDTFDDCERRAMTEAEVAGQVFVHPFNDPRVIEGQGTVGLELLVGDADIDLLFVPVGGGGLAAGVGTCFKALSPRTTVIGVEPAGAPSMSEALNAGRNVTLDSIDSFVDGAAVKRVGQLPFEVCKDVLDDMITVPEGRVCSTMLRLYNQDGIVVEPAGALAISALEDYGAQLGGKTVACILSGGNNDITRTEEIRERSLLYEGVKHYFIVRFPQRAGALREFVAEVLGPRDDITHFEYSKKTNREKGPAVVGIELESREDFIPLVGRMKQKGFFGEYLNDRPDLFHYLV